METNTQPVIPHTSKTRGLIIGGAVAVLVLIGIGMYLWGSSLPLSPQTPFNPPNNEPETPRANADIQIFRTVSSSNELSSIEADLESTNLSSLDTELELIERDLEG